MVSTIGSPSLGAQLESWWESNLLAEMGMDERLVGLAYERSKRMAPRGIAVTDKRIRIYPTYHNPKVGLLSVGLPAESDIPLDTVTKIQLSGSEWLTVVAEATGEHKLRLTRSRDADFVAEKIAARAGVAVTRPARITDVGGSDTLPARHSSPILGDAWLEKRSPRFQDRFTAVFGVVFVALSLYRSASVASCCTNSARGCSAGVTPIRLRRDATSSRSGTPNNRTTRIRASLATTTTAATQCHLQLATVS